MSFYNWWIISVFLLPLSLKFTANKWRYLNRIVSRFLLIPLLSYDLWLSYLAYTLNKYRKSKKEKDKKSIMICNKAAYGQRCAYSIYIQQNILNTLMSKQGNYQSCCSYFHLNWISLNKKRSIEEHVKMENTKKDKKKN